MLFSGIRIGFDIIHKMYGNRIHLLLQFPNAIRGFISGPANSVYSIR